MKPLLGCAACVMALAWSARATDAAAQNIDVVKPHRGRIVRPLDLPATVEAFEQADLYAKVSGYVSEVKVDLGDRVKAGQHLATLDVPEYAKELLEAKAQKAAKEAAAKASQAGVPAAAAAIKAAESAIKAADAHIQQTQAALNVSKKQTEHYRIDAALKETNLKRKEALFKDKVITDQEMDDFRTQWEIAKTDLGTAEVKVFAAEADILGAQSARDVAVSQKEIAVSQKEVAVAQQLAAESLVQVAAAQIEKINTLMEYTRIVAPFDGTITRRTIDRGALVQAATATRTMPVFSLQRIDKVRVFADVPETELGFIGLGGPVRVKGYGATAAFVEGKITRTSDTLNAASRTMKVEIDLDNPSGKLLPGMYVQAVFDVDARENALAIPKSAVIPQGTDRVVYVVRDGHAVRTLVKLGIDDGTRIEVREGLKEDDLVVLNAKAAPGAATAVNPVVKAEK